MVITTGIIVSVAILVCSRTLTRATFYRFARVLNVASPPSVLCPRPRSFVANQSSSRLFHSSPTAFQTFKDAMTSPEAESWYVASVKELQLHGLAQAFQAFKATHWGS